MDQILLELVLFYLLFAINVLHVRYYYCSLLCGKDLLFITDSEYMT
jgi:hypothetical protein